MSDPAANALAGLLGKRSTTRSAADYEHMFDDFVVASGGGRVGDRFTLPPGLCNADYHFATADYDLLLELKQISAYRPQATLDAYFNKLLSLGRVRQATRPISGKLEIVPESLSERDWNRFYGKFRPAVSEHLRKAARQLKETDRHLPHSAKPRLCGLVLINSGDYALPLDLMFRLVEWRVKREWQAGHFSKLDFVSCLTVDFAPLEGQHPLQGRHIIRPEPHPLLVGAVRRLYDDWLHYVANALGATVTFEPGASAPEPPLVLAGAYAGKLQRVDT